ncbi:related to Myosin light chain 2 [Saccharomycodes ludwigii]|uniref:Related to Myosin light chain 2 n=1 Tax=Saccharomycodes ludwigii TaxID=36035 RepID=A0A376B4A0_9ASCO|nr:hypothetical protein SCDLUD_000011 [Saccharomycodes ludwigii]KAH3902434.1 hypothetical protein SCDLUD_000011 [Saccharomycodes ludwigii]SSD59491.1 related to Myosin light chain 2 [Saccharomycodes ludwigii]
MNHSKSTTFSDFSQSQIKKVKDAFQIIDEDGDGTITEPDLLKLYEGLGKADSVEDIKKMLEPFNGSVTFTNFLSLMGQLVGDMPEENEIIEAFKVFGEHDTKTENDSFVGAGNADQLNVDYDELIAYLKIVGFDKDEDINRALKNFVTVNKLTGKSTFKGEKFLAIISE